MIKFQKKNKNIINLALPSDIQNNKKTKHKVHNTQQSIKKWNFSSTETHLRRSTDRKQQITMTQQFQNQSRKGIFSNKLIQAQFVHSKSQNNNGKGTDSSMKKYSIDGGYIFSERQNNRLTKGFPIQAKKNRYYVMKNTNIPKIKKSIRTQQLVKKITSNKQSYLHQKLFSQTSQSFKCIEKSFNDKFLKKRGHIAMKTQPNQNIRNTTSFNQDDFKQFREQAKIEIPKIKRPKRLDRTSIKVCYSKKDNSIHNLDTLFKQIQR